MDYKRLTTVHSLVAALCNPSLSRLSSKRFYLWRLMGALKWRVDNDWEACTLWLLLFVGSPIVSCNTDKFWHWIASIINGIAWWLSPLHILVYSTKQQRLGHYRAIIQYSPEDSSVKTSGVIYQSTMLFGSMLLRRLYNSCSVVPKVLIRNTCWIEEECCRLL